MKKRVTPKDVTLFLCTIGYKSGLKNRRFRTVALASHTHPFLPFCKAFYASSYGLSRSPQGSSGTGFLYPLTLSVCGAQPPKQAMRAFLLGTSFSIDMPTASGATLKLFHQGAFPKISKDRYWAWRYLAAVAPRNLNPVLHAGRPPARASLVPV